LTPNAISARLCGRADFLVAHAMLWDLDLLDRDGVFGFLSQVVERLGRGIVPPSAYLLTAGQRRRPIQ
jgi:hypothetical protein